jgi:hypothetical protein
MPIAFLHPKISSTFSVHQVVYERCSMVISGRCMIHQLVFSSCYVYFMRQGALAAILITIFIIINQFP